MFDLETETNGGEIPKLRLMVIISEPISEWINKGEVVDRYYNPGDLFDEVYLVLCNSDAPDFELTQRLVGRAKLQIRNFPFSKAKRVATFGLQPELLKWWAIRVVDYAREVQPNLVRCHGASQNALAALAIKTQLNIPYVVSLHTNPDVDIRNRPGTPLQRIYNQLTIRIEKKTLRGADLVMPVYEPIIPYLKRLRITRYKVHYNVLNSSALLVKENYSLNQPVNLICVGRLYELKNPLEILKAVQFLPDVRLSIVGDGPLREILERQSLNLKIDDRVKFIPYVSNDELCLMLLKSDLFVVHTEHWEISKSVLEAMLTGLPVVINKRIGNPVPELHEQIVRFVENTSESYKFAISELLNDNLKREMLGRTAASISHGLWSPAKCEAAVVDTYAKILNKSL